MIDIEEDLVDELLPRCIEKYDANKIIENGLALGIREVGVLFEEGEYFLPELMLGAEIMKSAMNILEPLLTSSDILEWANNPGKIHIHPLLLENILPYNLMLSFLRKKPPL